MEVTLKERGPHDTLPESRDITSPVERAPGKAPVPEVPPVKEALKRGRVSAPAPWKDASLGVGVNPRREPQIKVSFEHFIPNWRKKSLGENDA